MTSVTLEDFRRDSFWIAESIAPGWEQWRHRLEESLFSVRELMICALAPRRGDTVLELAAGAGDTGFEAAEIVGRDGRLICTDFSPSMLEVARRRGAELGLANVDYRVMDAEQIELETESVDGVLCRFGYMLMADPEEALIETRRVLRPGGRLALAVWAAPEQNPFFASIARIVIERGHAPPPDPRLPSPFSMANEVQTRRLLLRLGFSEMWMEKPPVRFGFRDLDEYLGFMADTAGPLAMVLRQLSESEREGLLEDLASVFAAFSSDRGYTLPGMALVWAVTR